MQGIKQFSLNKRFKIFLNYFVGPVLFIWLSYSIYRQVQQQKDLPGTWQKLLDSFTGVQSWKVILVIVLMFCNWGLETRKWQLLIKGIQTISFGRAFRAIFSGQAFAINTLNNVGEYVGRVLYLKEGNRLRAIAVTVVGSISQIIVTLVMGLSGLLYMKIYLLNSEHLLKDLSVFWLDGLIFALSSGTVALIMLYYGLSWVTKTVEKIPFVAKYAFYIQKVEDFHWKELTRILVLSFVRYVVFVVQYLLLLQVFEVEANWVPLAWLVCVMFLVLAIVPSIALAELGLRGKVSIILLGLVSVNTIGIIATATAIWFINRVVPALAGSLFILGIKLFKKVPE